MTYITNAKLTTALSLIEPNQILVASTRINGDWFLTVKEVA